MLLLNLSACLDSFIHLFWDAAVPHLWWELKAVAVLGHKSTVIGGFGALGRLFLLLRFQALVSLHAINFAQDFNLCAMFSTTVNIINNLI